MGELVLGHSDNLSKSLQNSNLSAVDGRCTANATVETLKGIRNGKSFDLFWEKVLTHAKRLDVNEPTLPRQRSQPRSMQNYFGYGKGKEAVHTCPKDLYRKHYFEAFDTVINCIENRFDQEDFKMYALLEQVLLKAAKHDEYEEELKEVILFYKEDFDESLLRSQLLTFSINFQSTTEKDANIILSAICTYLQKLSPGMKSLLSQVIRLAKLVLVAAATNATSERSFSAMRRAKSYLQSTMGQQRLNNIMVLHVHKERTDKLNLITVTNEFADGSETRLARFGRFNDTDRRRKNVPVKTQSVQVSSIKF